MDLKRLELSTEDEKKLGQAAEVACIVFCGKTGEKQTTPLTLCTVGGVSALDTLKQKHEIKRKLVRFQNLEVFNLCYMISRFRNDFIMMNFSNDVDHRTH